MASEQHWLHSAHQAGDRGAVAQRAAARRNSSRQEKRKRTFDAARAGAPAGAMSRTDFAADTFVAASGRGVHLLRQRAPGGGGDGAFSSVVVDHAAAVGAVCWNRNNKVVAAGSADGMIQLLYSSGQVMAVLPRDAANLGAITGLSWCGGSKRLAAGTDRGSVYLFDMAQQAGKVRRAVGCRACRWLCTCTFLCSSGRLASAALHGRAHMGLACAVCFVVSQSIVHGLRCPEAHRTCVLHLQAPPLELPGHLGGVTAVEFQHEDKFLAVARWGAMAAMHVMHASCA